MNSELADMDSLHQNELKVISTFTDLTYTKRCEAHSKKPRIQISNKVSFKFTISVLDMSEEEIRNTWYTEKELSLFSHEDESLIMILPHKKVRPDLTITKAYKYIKRNPNDPKNKTKALELLHVWNTRTNGFYRGIEESLDEDLRLMMMITQNSHQRTVLAAQRKFSSIIDVSKSTKKLVEILREISENESRYSKEFSMLVAQVDAMTVMENGSNQKEFFQKEKLEHRIPSWKNFKKSMMKKKALIASSA